MDSFDGLDDLFPEYAEKELGSDGTVADNEPEDDIFEKNPINTDNFDEDFWKTLNLTCFLKKRVPQSMLRMSLL